MKIIKAAMVVFAVFILVVYGSRWFVGMQECQLLDDEYTRILERYRPKHRPDTVLYYDVIGAMPPGINAKEVARVIDWSFAQWRKVAPDVPLVKEQEGASAKVKFVSKLSNGRLAITSMAIEFYGNSAVPVWGGITINRRPYSLYLRADTIHLPSLLLHETGHVLGLGHVVHRHERQVMSVPLALGEDRSQLGQCDIAAIGLRYR